MFNVQFVVWSVVGFVVGLGLIAWSVLDMRVYAFFRRKMIDRHPVLNKVLDKTDKLLEAVAHYKQQKSALCWAMLNSLLFYVLAIVNIYIAARVFAVEVDFMDVAIATPIIMLIMNIPLSIGNLGLMEFAFTVVFEMVALGSVLGLSVALLMRVKSLLDGAMGGILYPFFVNSKHDSE